MCYVGGPKKSAAVAHRELRDWPFHAHAAGLRHMQERTQFTTVKHKCQPFRLHQYTFKRHIHIGHATFYAKPERLDLFLNSNSFHPISAKLTSAMFTSE